MSDVTFTIVQHGEKVGGLTDPGLTVRGLRQATACADALVKSPVVAIYSSPLRRAVETAQPIGGSVGLPVRLHDALRERMDWSADCGMSMEAFVADWRRATIDRSYQPGVGESSESAGARFAGALRHFASAHPGGNVVCVSHGGVTVDFLRDLLGDEELAERAPTVIDDGIPGGAMTTIRIAAHAWCVVHIAAIGHVSEADRSDHHA